MSFPYDDEHLLSNLVTAVGNALRPTNVDVAAPTNLPYTHARHDVSCRVPESDRQKVMTFITHVGGFLVPANFGSIFHEEFNKLYDGIDKFAAALERSSSSSNNNDDDDESVGADASTDSDAALHQHQSPSSPSSVLLHRFALAIIFSSNQKNGIELQQESPLQKSESPPQQHQSQGPKRSVSISYQGLICCLNALVQTFVPVPLSLVEILSDSLSDWNDNYLLPSFLEFAHKFKLTETMGAGFPIAKHATILCRQYNDSLSRSRSLDPLFFPRNDSVFLKRVANELPPFFYSSSTGSHTYTNDFSPSRWNRGNNNNREPYWNPRNHGFASLLRSFAKGVNYLNFSCQQDLLSITSSQGRKSPNVFTSDRVTFVGGASGTGKTFNSILQAAKQDSDRTKTTVIYSVVENIGRDIAEYGTSHAETRTKRFFNNLISRSLDLKLDGSGNLVPRWKRPLQQLENNNATSGKIYIIFDEFVQLPNYRSMICRLWKSTLRPILSTLFNCDESLLHLVIIGNGVENFQQDQAGSNPSTYQIFTVHASFLFPKLLNLIINDGIENKSSSADPPTLVDHHRAVIARSLLTLLYHHSKQDDGDDQYIPRPTDPATHRFLQLVSTSARCAALAIEELKDLADKASRNGNMVAYSPMSIRTYLPAWSTHVVARFCSMNGLSGKTPDQRRLLIGSALRHVMMKSKSLGTEEWEQLGTQTGLLSDQAFWVSETQRKIAGSRFEDVTGPVERTNQTTDSSSNSTSSRYYYVFHRDLPRFSISEAHVAMYLLGVGSIVGSGGGLFGQGDWKLFESSVADYIMLCWLLRISAPSPPTFTHTRGGGEKSNTITFTHPAAAFAHSFPNNFAVYRGVLPFALYDKTFDKESESKQVEFDRNLAAKLTPLVLQRTQQQGSGHVFENTGNTPFADAVAVAPGLVILVQCKYYVSSTMSEESTARAFAIMVDQNMESLKYLATLAAGGLPAGDANITLRVILACGTVDSPHFSVNQVFSSRNISATTRNKLTKLGIKTVDSRVTAAFPHHQNSKKDLGFFGSLLNPVMQFPFRSDSESEELDDIWSKHEGLPLPPQQTQMKGNKPGEKK